MSAVACATVPKITVVVGGSYGPSSFAMVRERERNYHSIAEFFQTRSLTLQGGRAMQPNFLFSWPYSRLAIASPDHQLAVMRQQGLETSAEKEAELLERCEPMKPLGVSCRGYRFLSLSLRLQEEASVHPHSNLVTDAVILPHETRQV